MRRSDTPSLLSHDPFLPTAARLLDTSHDVYVFYYSTAALLFCKAIWSQCGNLIYSMVVIYGELWSWQLSLLYQGSSSVLWFCESLKHCSLSGWTMNRSRLNHKWQKTWSVSDTEVPHTCQAFVLVSVQGTFVH